MIEFPWRRLFRQTWHPSYEELVLFLDGELGPKTDDVEAHLRSCWSCRLRREKVDRVISAFMEARSASFGDGSKFPTRGLASFNARLDRLDLESGSPALLAGLLRTRIQEGLSALKSWRVATLVASLAIIIALLIRSSSVPTVSAKEVLGRVKQAEARQLQGAPAPVIYEKIQLRRQSSVRRPETLTWEIWNDPHNKRLRSRVTDGEGGRFLPTMPANLANGEGNNSVQNSGMSRQVTQSPAALPPVLAELEQVYKTHHADLRRPLSSSSFEALRDSMGKGSEKVHDRRLPDGESAVVLKSSGEGPFHHNTIVSAEFTVRIKDWHPVEQRLRVQQEEGVVDYTLGQIAFDLLTLNSLPPSLFSDVTEAVLSVPSPQLAPLVDLASADLLTAEIETWHALHSVNACLGRPVAVNRVGRSHIEVSGVVETEERKAQILEVLLGIPHVNARIRTVVEDWATTSAGKTPPVKADAIAAGQVSQAAASEPRLALEDLLKRHFSSTDCAESPSDSRGQCVSEKIAEVSRKALTTSEAVLVQVGALRRLVQWSTSMQQSDLRVSTRRLLELMVQDHVNALKIRLDVSRSAVEPILSSWLQREVGSSAASQTASGLLRAEGDWAAVTLHLCSGVERTANLALGMFVETNEPVMQGEAAVSELLSAFSRLDVEFKEVEARVASELSEPMKTLSSGRSAAEQK